MKLINFNVNGLRARWETILKIIKDSNPDVMTMQESKITHQDFAEYSDKFNELGYTSNLSAHTRNGLHGVLTIFKSSMFHKYSEHLYDGRVLITHLDGINIYNVYIHQGQDLGSNEYKDKLDLLNYLTVSITARKGEHIVVAGDFNVCPDEKSVWSTEHWHDGVTSCSPSERQSFRDILEKGNLYNVSVADGQVPFTWYGYKTSWRKYKGNNLVDKSGKYGIKCDHILANIETSVINIMRDYRLPQTIVEGITPSDHIPMEITINDVN